MACTRPLTCLRWAILAAILLGTYALTQDVCLGPASSCPFMAVVLYALRDIAPGEELTISYSPRKEDRDEIRATGQGVLPCRCCKPTCPGWVFKQARTRGRSGNGAQQGRKSTRETVVVAAAAAGGAGGRVKQQAPGKCTGHARNQQQQARQNNARSMLQGR